jgi:hypothetical protein
MTLGLGSSSFFTLNVYFNYTMSRRQKKFKFQNSKNWFLRTWNTRVNFTLNFRVMKTLGLGPLSFFTSNVSLDYTRKNAQCLSPILAY